jgi:hypothetical protein
LLASLHGALDTENDMVLAELLQYEVCNEDKGEALIGCLAEYTENFADDFYVDPACALFVLYPKEFGLKTTTLIKDKLERPD